MTLEAGQQHILADVVDELRRLGVAGLGATRGFYAGPLFVVAEGGDMSGIVIGARTGSQGGGGQYSVFYNAVPEGAGFTEVAWVEGLQQNRENRSNLALVNTGEVDGSPSVFHLEIYDGETGLLAETVVTKPIAARGWHQINGILGSYAPETRQGHIRTSGSRRCQAPTPSWPTGWSTTAALRESAAATEPTCRRGSRGRSGSDQGKKISTSGIHEKAKRYPRRATKNGEGPLRGWRRLKRDPPRGTKRQKD